MSDPAGATQHVAAGLVTPPGRAGMSEPAGAILYIAGTVPPGGRR